MTKYHIEQAKVRYSIDDSICENCGQPATQLAHRISNTKMYKKKYGEKLIHHNFNMVSTCGLYCNGKFNIGNRPLKVLRMVELITERGDERLNANYITNYLEVE